MLKVGLTGGIGSGKSSVAVLFEQLGVDIIDADQIAKEITAPKQAAFQKIVKHFGKSILDIIGHINRKKLRKIIFTNPTEKKWLEALLHPDIANVIRERIKYVKSPYCIVVIPLLAETDVSRSLVNRVLVIDTPIEIQLYRTQLRDNLNKAEAKKMLAAQAAREERLTIADDVILNDEGKSKLNVQVNHLHNFYLNLSKNKVT